MRIFLGKDGTNRWMTGIMLAFKETSAAGGASSEVFVIQQFEAADHNETRSAFS
jgi:hypothetical protein